MQINVAEIREKLVKRLTGLSSKIDNGRRELREGSSRVVNSTAADGGDVGELDPTQDVIEAIVNSRVVSQKEVEDAIRRIDKGTYGICEECEKAIHPGRLMAHQTARRCIKCQEGLERLEGVLQDERTLRSVSEDNE